MKPCEYALEIIRVVLVTSSHIYKQGGINLKEYIYGNSKVIVFSPYQLTEMTKEEQKTFFQEEWNKGNVILKEIAQAAHDCLLDSYLKQKQA